MKHIEYIQMDRDYYRFSYRRLTADYFPGFYHYHRGFEFNYIHEGEGHVTIDQRFYELRPNTLIWYKPFQLHRIHIDVSPARPYVRTILMFEPPVYERFLAPYPRLSSHLQTMLAADNAAQVIAFDEEPRLLAALFDYYEQRFGVVSEFERKETFGLLLTQLLDYIQPRQQLEASAASAAAAAPRSVRYSERIMQWIEQRYAEGFELDALADELHLSKHYVSRIFRKETGSSITDYLLNRRMRQACWLLITTDASVQSIGHQVGFASFSHFCHSFKAIMNVTPQKFRTQAKT
ncbi:AraC family transcriptional regulator [Paenibacillus cymbidii]|uniref:AraC family transcriptional regulator n=1 Tax=Paenibacillus cymbidii TaxID=1639034 RepID=UPI001081317C|nr:AraC family transcriptional regulator [Paenibacillus cymbidii]